MNKKNALIVFVRNPELGKVKTRLAKTLGEEKALKVYKKLLSHTHDIIKNINCDKYIFYSDQISENDIWENKIFTKELQVEGNLGDKMAAAVEKTFLKNYNSVTVIGSDCFNLEQKQIENAIGSLMYNDVVIGPATDGGYYLLGMKKFYQDIFDLEAWSTPTVFDTTLKICKSRYLQVVILQTLNDVDVEADVNFEYQ